ncbi:uncharacterized protein LOC133336852 [Musca vetustissima]|uniref:uncharacterized protein LOC133336852 n=1 Tax=Musca vetustissima TaxID=27455 RepID=UPI002AB7DF6D|nr:uncharacterized protein LOC133336852 [Musca vetustissima]
MNKFIIFVIMLGIKETLQQSDSSNALLEMAKMSVEDCYEDEAKTKKIEITDDGFQDILMGSRDAVRNAKCIRYCIMKKHDLFSEDNSLDETAVIPFFTYLFNNAVEIQQLKGIIAMCNEGIMGETDRCERSHKATMCILEKFNAAGMKNI